MGGTMIQIGFDKNNNNKLDEDPAIGEVTESFPVCNGLNGVNAGDVRIAEEPAGENCPEGGLAIFKNDEFIGFICNGSDGVAGDAAAPIVLDVIALESGIDSECTYGGEKLLWGQDLEPFDGVLQEEEILETLLSCDPAPEFCSVNLLVRESTDFDILQGCFDSFNGDIVVDGNVTSLAPLSMIATLNGSLILQNSNIDSLEGLGALTTVQGNLEIQEGNIELTSFVGAELLQKIGGSLVIASPNGSEDFSDFESIEEIGELDISNQDYLTSFVGLERSQS